MATTTNYSWTTPDDTALVKDGAAAIRSLGTAIDTTVFNNAGAAINKTIVDAKGDLIVGTAADTVARLASSASNGDLLTVDTSTASGLKWAAPAAPVSGLTLITTAAFSGSSAVNINNCFTSTYTNYKIMLVENGSSNVGIFFRLRASGADNTSSNYSWGLVGINYNNNAAYLEGINGSLQTAFKLGATGNSSQNAWTADIFQPQATALTSYFGIRLSDAASPNGYGLTTSGFSSVTTSYDGLTIYPSSGNITGTYWIYGYQKA